MISFTKWIRWCLRDTTTPSDPFDPPKEFDVSGIYLLAHFRNEAQKADNKNGLLYLNPNVIYIGQSKKVTARLEGKRHEKVRIEYQKRFDDEEMTCLYFSLSYTDWTSWAFREKDIGPARYACLLYLERKLIWEFARTYSKIPLLNRQ